MDPPGCKDIDDALHCRELPNGNFEVRPRARQPRQHFAMCCPSACMASAVAGRVCGRKPPCPQAPRAPTRTGQSPAPLPPARHIQLGVHIADVTHFLKPGTAMDDEAAARATTTYLVQRRIDMLPKALTEDICSLRWGGPGGPGGAGVGLGGWGGRVQGWQRMNTLR